ncbi:STAS domain-containing protein [Kitasatospora sp. NPDC056138]|uniref:STAS domain-containing protein n=1 Tax=Kitasatospora sp. NPDC056138 TaxID=3345724 RepID=UPI0035D6DB64
MDAHPADADRFTVSARPWARGVLLGLQGELDHDSAGPLREALEAVLRESPERLVVDCSGLDFCDSTGLNLLLRARLTSEAAGGLIVLVGPPPVVARMLEVTGAQDIFRVYATVEEATAEPGGT